MNHESVPGYGMPILGHATISIRVSCQIHPTTSIGKPPVHCSLQIMKYVFDGIPVDGSRVLRETGNSLNGESEPTASW